MFSTSHALTGEHLLDLLAACRGAGLAAVRLASQAPNGELRTLLHERAEHYRLSEAEIIECMRSVPDPPFGHQPSGLTVRSGTDIAAAWEATECDALMQFRDALDSDLPSDVATTVLRHIHDGVEALERLRALGRS